MEGRIFLNPPFERRIDALLSMLYQEQLAGQTTGRLYCEVDLRVRSLEDAYSIVALGLLSIDLAIVHWDREGTKKSGNLGFNGYSSGSSYFISFFNTTSSLSPSSRNADLVSSTVDSFIPSRSAISK